MAKYNGNGNGNLWPAIGIDLGSTKACVAVWKEQNDHVEIISNDLGKRTTPSYVAFGEKERLVGESAKNQGARNFSNTVYDAKRLIGKSFTDETLQNDMKLWPFKVTNSHKKNNKPTIKVTFKDEQKNLAPEEISSMVLLKMKETAEAYLGLEVKSAVVTVPAYFNDAQRQATKDAGRIAGFNVTNIINEPTAAAIAYGIHQKMDAAKKDVARNLLIFDLGGGTFDASLVTIENEKFEVKGVKGDTHLGGSDFVDRMVQHFVEEFKTKKNKDISGNYKALIRLRTECEKAKNTLSANKVAYLNIDYIYESINFESKITRVKFEELNGDLFEKCLKYVKKCLVQAKIGKDEVNDVVLVGGSARIPKIQEMLKDFFNVKELCQSINLDEVVAQGAAIQAAMLSGARINKDFKLLDVTRLSIGYKSSTSNSMEIVIPRDTAIPTPQHLVKVVESHEDGDKGMFLRVYEGEKANIIENNFLGSFKLPVAKKSPLNNLISKGTVKHNVWFEIDLNGILTVSTQQVGTTYEERNITVLNHTGRLSEHELDRMAAEAKKYNEKDKQNKKYMDAILELKRNFDSMWVTMNVCSEKFKKVDSNMEDVIQDISQYLSRNSVLDKVRDFENKLKEIQGNRTR